MKKLCSLSLDLDNQWSYMKIHGDKGWESYLSYFDIFIPYVLNILDKLELKITFFIVGHDAFLKNNHPWLREITSHGHEVGNHSFNHESWLHLYDKEHIEKEIRETEELIVEVTNQKPVGFRGPGFSWSPELFEILSERGYLYDASTLPSFIGPLARLYYFWTANLSKEEKKTRQGLFGSVKDGLRPVKPYYWQIKNGQKLLEIPVTTIPYLKIPFHLSYLLYLSNYSEGLMKQYLKLAINLCHISDTPPSFLLHPVDLIGGDQLKELAFFPGMNISSEQKVKIFMNVISELNKNFKLVNMSKYAQAMIERGVKKIIKFKSNDVQSVK